MWFREFTMLWEVFHKQRVFPLRTWLMVISSNGRWWSRLMVTVSSSPFSCLKYWSYGDGRREPKLVLLATEGQQRKQHEPKPWVRSWKAVCPGWVFAITDGRCDGYRKEMRLQESNTPWCSNASNNCNNQWMLPLLLLANGILTYRVGAGTVGTEGRRLSQTGKLIESRLENWSEWLGR